MLFAKMIGKEATLKDIVLVQLGNETETEEEAESATRDFYRVVTVCEVCSRRLKLVLQASSEGIRGFHRLLLDHLGLVCGPCSSHVRGR
ncbi:E7 [Erinaceus europaeus papillomavirus 1]|uniref:Protein E7 n=1 Tax=Erinaceus europaeus papillomavirus 1 TaxID=445217 RepID=B7TQN8_9PAPI|nr:E7 [Erinaceus europaeus papillomavirus 1]ACK76235.1 E7 [Erinaceus europaeus papillomavirus 1]